MRNPNSAPITLNVRFYEALTAATPGLRTCNQLIVPAFLIVQFTLPGQCTLGVGNHHGMLLLEDAASENLDIFYAYSRSQTPSGNGFSVEGFPAGNFSGAPSDVIGLKRQAAAGFLTYLQQPPQQARFQRAAFRTFDGTPGSVITQANGMLPGEPRNVLSPASPQVLDLIQRSWAELRKRARVLLVIDVSGSMGDPVPNSGDTKLELAKRAAIRALGQFASDDDVGLWIFSSDFPPSHQPYFQLLPVAPLGPQPENGRLKQ